MLNMPISKIDSHPHGDYVSRIANDADTFSDGLLVGFTQLFSGVITVAGVIIFMLRLDVFIALLVILLTPLSIFTAKFITGRTYKKFSEQAADRGAITDMINESVWGADIIRAFDYGSRIRDTFDEKNEKLMNSSLLATFYSSLTNPSTRFVNSLIYAGIAVFGALSALGGGITVGVLTSFLSYAREYAKPFNEITGVITEMQNAFACGDRLFELIDEKRENESAGRAETVNGHIEFKNVDFSYDKKKKLIQNVSIDAAPGERVAIVGPTGAGKTTLINLLMRFYDVDVGEVLLDGRDIRTLSRGELRKNIGMVLQETWLFTGSIMDNLRLGNPGASDEEVYEAARAAHAHKFIEKLPKGYDTLIGDGGSTISQGQRQLLCIARLMLSLPPILILDEATSSIDTRTEMKIQDAFMRMMEGRTSFVVAHRLSTIKSADLILYMENGNVTEQGTHSELLKKNGAYAKLYRSQFAEN